MKKEFDYIVYVGRFQPLHDGHMTTLNLALEKADNVIIIIGSANAAPTPKNPWTAEQRRDMIIAAMAGDERLFNINFIFAEDRLYKEPKWFTYVESSVKSIAGKGKIGLIGHEKDATSYYLKNRFPRWEFVETGPYIKERGNSAAVVSSTKVRELMFTNHLGYTKSNLPLAVYDELESFTMTPQYEYLQEWYDFIIEEEKIVEPLENGMSFLTVDSVVTQSSHVLLVQRDELPGKGLWALPGVHVDQNETMDDASVRALIKETSLRVPEKVLRGSLKKTHHFDHPDRSLRARLTSKKARTITMAYYYELDSSQPLPTEGLKGGEGIRKAWWFSFAEIKRMRSQLFEDHADIIDYFIG